MASPGEKPTYTADKETVILNGRPYPASVSVDVGGKSITARPENINGQIIWRHLGADFGVYLDTAQEAKLKQGINAAVGDLQHSHKPDAAPREATATRQRDPNIPSGPSGRNRRELAIQHSLADNVVKPHDHGHVKHPHHHHHHAVKPQPGLRL